MTGNPFYEKEKQIDQKLQRKIEKLFKKWEGDENRRILAVDDGPIEKVTNALPELIDEFWESAGDAMIDLTFESNHFKRFHFDTISVEK